jgi:hypothetical protein
MPGQGAAPRPARLAAHSAPARQRRARSVCPWNAPPGRWVQPRAAATGAGRSATSSTSGSAKLCSRPFWSSSRTESSKALRCSRVSCTARCPRSPGTSRACCCTRTGAGPVRRSWWRTPGRRAAWKTPAAGRCRPSGRRWPAPACSPSDPTAHAPRPCRVPAPGQQLAQFGLRFAALTSRLATGSSMVCSLKRSMRGKPGGGQEFAVHPQVGVAARARPVGQLGVDALAVDHQRRQQADVLATEGVISWRQDAVGRFAAAPACRRARNAGCPA